MTSQKLQTTFDSNFDPRLKSKQQQRSELESADLAKTVRDAERNNKSVIDTIDGNHKLPTYLEGPVVERADESQVQVLSLELKSLPRDIDEVLLKKQLFSKHHVISVEAEKDNLTGICNGKARA